MTLPMSSGATRSSNVSSWSPWISVTEVPGEQELTLELRVAPDDMGKVIGRQGRIAKEIRTLIRSCAQRTGQKVSVEIVD